MKKIPFLSNAILIALFLFLSSCTKDNSVSPVVVTPVTVDSTGIVSGIVKDLNGLPIKFATINCVSSVGKSYFGGSDSLGIFKVNNIEPGNYSLFCFKNGYSTDTSTFVLHKKDSLSFTIHLTPTFWYKINPNANRLNAYSSYDGLYINPSNDMFVSTPDGSAVISQSAMMKTSNFGINWSNVISANSLSKVFRLASNNFFVFSEKWQDGNGNFMGENKLYRSLDFAETWSSIVDFNFDFVLNYSITNISNIYFLCIVGASYPNHNTQYLFYKSNDLGNTWTSYHPISNYNIVSVNRAASGKVYIQNYTDSIYYTIDGTTWNLKSNSSSNYQLCLRNSVILPGGYMIANGENSNYYISNDGGETFSQINSNITTNIPKVEKFVFNSKNDIYCYYPGDYYGQSGCVYKSSDNCVSLIKCEDGLPSSYFISGLYIVDDYAYLICNGFVYKSSNKTTEKYNIAKTKKFSKSF